MANVENMTNLVRKYQEQLIVTTGKLEELQNSYKSKSTDNYWGREITKEFFEKISLGYNVEIDIYEKIIKDLTKL
jgi:hypothetical protein